MHYQQRKSVSNLCALRKKSRLKRIAKNVTLCIKIASNANFAVELVQNRHSMRKKYWQQCSKFFFDKSPQQNCAFYKRTKREKMKAILIKSVRHVLSHDLSCRKFSQLIWQSYRATSLLCGKLLHSLVKLLLNLASVCYAKYFCRYRTAYHNILRQTTLIVIFLYIVKVVLSSVWIAAIILNKIWIGLQQSYWR